jgi:stearoyl-CoA desaturase (delta-9 desaturase)
MSTENAGTAKVLLNRQQAMVKRRDFLIALFANMLPYIGFFTVIGLIASGHPVHWFEVILFLSGHFLAMIGLEVGYHRYFAHKAFKTHPWFEALLAILGSSSFQGGVILWTSIHRRHHAHTDTALDPHSPVVPQGSSLAVRMKGFLNAHIGWVFDQNKVKPMGWERLVADMFRVPSLFRLHVNYWKWGLLGLLLPAIAGGLWYQSWYGVWTGFLWGGLLRVFSATQMMHCTNSFGHTIGSRMFRRADNSRNNNLTTFISIGLSLHNNHHAFPGAANLQFRWWQLDLAGMLISLLEKLGIVWDVRHTGAGVIEEKLLEQPGMNSQVAE